MAQAAAVLRREKRRRTQKPGDPGEEFVVVPVHPSVHPERVNILKQSRTPAFVFVPDFLPFEAKLSPSSDIRFFRKPELPFVAFLLFEKLLLPVATCRLDLCSATFACQDISLLPATFGIHKAKLKNEMIQD